MILYDKKSKLKIDVLDRQCFDRSCFRLGFDRGTFVQGRGYVSYHTEKRAVCMTRFLHGCPCSTICPQCRTLHVEGLKECERCHVILITHER